MQTVLYLDIALLGLSSNDIGHHHFNPRSVHTIEPEEFFHAFPRIFLIHQLFVMWNLLST